jgi:hypothetical protein
LGVRVPNRRVLTRKRREGQRAGPARSLRRPRRCSSYEAIRETRPRPDNLADALPGDRGAHGVFDAEAQASSLRFLGGDAPAFLAVIALAAAAAPVLNRTRALSVGNGCLERLLAADERAKALVLLTAGRTADQVRPQARDRSVGVLARELELDVAVELVKANLAADLRLSRAEKAA